MAEGKCNQFKDNATTKIIAFDFDNTLTDSDIFPHIGKPRKYAKEVVNCLYDLGVTVLIWTCRDKEDIFGMQDWLDENGFKYHDINTCIAYAPFHYEARKIYAHMYVDDKGFGWEDRDNIMLDVFMEFAMKHLGKASKEVANIMIENIFGRTN